MPTRISLVSTPGPMPTALPSNGPAPMTAAQAALSRRVSYVNGVALSEVRRERHEMQGLNGLGELVQVVT